MPPIREVAFPDVVYRVARRKCELRYSRISPQDDQDPNAGHRWDVLGGGVLYAGTTQRVAFLETLGFHRPSPGVVLEAADDSAAFMEPGCLPRDWRELRSVYELEAQSSSRDLGFVDLVDVGTRTALQRILSDALRPMGVDHLDVPEVTSKNRVQTRFLARVIYTLRNEDGSAMYGGIRYASRYDPREECWAIFDHFSVESVRQSPIGIDHPVFGAVARELGLRVF